VKRLDVARQSRHQLAHRVAIEERRRQPLKMGEALVAQVEHDVLTCPLEYVDLGEAQQELADQGGQEGQHEQPQAIDLPWAIWSSITRLIR